MTSTVRVSEIKRGKSNCNKNFDGRPKEGTTLRLLYEAFRSGQVVSVRKEFGESASRYISYLRDFYGMEIEPVKADTGRIIGSRLVGEWDGPYYVPIERIVSL